MSGTKQPRHTIWKARTVALVSGLVLAGVVVATAAIPWFRTDVTPTTVAGVLTSGTRASSSSRNHPGRPDTPPEATEQGRVVEDEDVTGEQLAGIWQLEKHGQRTITIHPDGTATATVRLDLIGSLLYGEELSMELTWSLEDRIMTQTITGGEPADAVARLVRDWGGERRYRVVEVTDKQLILAEVDDDNDRDVWTAVVDSTVQNSSTTPQE